MIALQSLTRTDLAALLAPQLVGQKLQADVRAKQIFTWVYQRNIDQWSLMSDLPNALRTWLQDNIEILALNEASRQEAEDGTMKFLWKLADNKTIESVLIPVSDDEEPNELTRLTICISSQVGCAMKCGFCLTGIQGLDRHLSAAEIVTQVWQLRRIAPITNIVFMGMGEPLHNLDNVIQACKILLDPNGMNFSKRKITVSTSGIVPAIARLGEEVGVKLAISLNASHDEQREEVMPVNKKWPIAELLAACRAYPAGPFNKVMFEYVLLAGVNDTLADAERLFQLLKNMPAKINLIPFNEHPAAPFKRPTDATVDAFHQYLVQRRLITTVRRSRGRDILAACGQLRSLFGTARGTDKHNDTEYRLESDGRNSLAAERRAREHRNADENNN